MGITKQILGVLALVAVTVLMVPGTARAFDIKTGTIANNKAAPATCTPTCKWYGGWSGQWTNVGGGAVCGCNKPQRMSAAPNDANAGTIWNNKAAPANCTPACKWYGGWNGQWRNTGGGSVCGCKQNVR